MKSMTGFGKSITINENFEIEVEIKSVNHRFLDLRISVPKEMNSFELFIRELVTKKIKRGKVDLRLTYYDKRSPKIELDKEKLKAVWNIYQEAKKCINYQQTISLEKILSEHRIIVENKISLDSKLFKEVLSEAVNQSINEQQAFALSEGKSMQVFFVSSLSKISSSLNVIKKEFPNYKNELFMKFKQQIAEIINDDINEEYEKRILTETAFYIEKADVNEEIVRLNNHIEKFKETLYITGKEVGKVLNFILQEMLREINTIGSKFNSISVFSQVLTIKEEIEKCREIVQNVE